MVLGLGPLIAAESSEKAVISPAVGVQHQNRAPGAMEAHGLADLIQNKLAVGFMLRRSQGFGAASDLDWVRVDDPDSAQELSKGQLKAIIETPKNDGIALILLTGRVEVKYFFHPEGLARRRLSLLPCFEFPEKLFNLIFLVERCQPVVDIVAQQL
jgi:hypothetical protein